MHVSHSKPVCQAGTRIVVWSEWEEKGVGGRGKMCDVTRCDAPTTHPRAQEIEGSLTINSYD